MQYIKTIALGLTVIFLLYLWTKHQRPKPNELTKAPLKASISQKPELKTQPVKKSSPTLKPIAEKPQPNAPVEDKSQTKDKSLTNKYAKKSKYVSFEVKEGLAVSFGDIVLGKPSQGVSKGIYQPSRPQLWPSNIIPYSIDPELPIKEVVVQAINYFNNNTTIQFVPFEGQKHSIYFKKSEEICASYLGRSGGHQPIFLSTKCNFNSVLHEIMHALGFVHEHSRTDRDKYLTIHWDKILKDKWPQFAMVPDSLVHDYIGSVFDFNYKSIMLYPPTSFADTPGEETMTSNTNESIEPSAQALAPIDIERIEYLYGR